MTELDQEDIAEMRLAASAAVGLFPRVEIDPAVAVAVCDLAAEALRVRATACRDCGRRGCDPADCCGVLVCENCAEAEGAFCCDGNGGEVHA